MHFGNIIISCRSKLEQDTGFVTKLGQFTLKFYICRIFSLIRHCRNLMPMAQEARKPMFFLKPADGAIGSHAKTVYDAYRDFEDLTKKILLKAGILQA